MAQAQAAYLPRGLVTRRAAVATLVLAIGLAAIGAYAANSYIAGEATKVAAPIRSVLVAGRDIEAGSFVRAADLSTAQVPIVGELAPFYVTTETAPASGIAVKAIRKGQPILVGDVVAAETAGTVAPLVPLTVKVGDQQQPVVGGLNIPLDRFSAPPPPVRVGDRVDVWASFVTPAGAGSTEAVLSDVQIVYLVGGAAQPSGFVIGVTAQQLDRFLFYVNTGASMVMTVRSSQRS